MLFALKCGASGTSPPTSIDVYSSYGGEEIVNPLL